MLFSSISLQQDLRTEESYEIPARSFAVTQPRRSSFSIKMQSANSPAIDSSPCTPAALIPSIDSTAAWEVRRAAWLAPRSNGIPDGGKRKRLRELLSGNGGESGTANRLRTLEELLENSIELSLGNGRENASEESSGITGRAMERGTSAQASGSASPAVTSESKGKKVATILRKASHAILRIDDEPIPDDGFPIRQSDKAREVNVDRASEAILAAFRQGRLLKDALPLALVTKLLYRSWTVDGTIPTNYGTSLATLTSMYNPFNTTTPHDRDATSTKILPSRALTTAATTSPLDTMIQGDGRLSGVGTTEPSTRESERSTLEGNGTGGKKSNPLHGSRWRIEKDVDSCSDVI